MAEVTRLSGKGPNFPLLAASWRAWETQALEPGPPHGAGVILHKVQVGLTPVIPFGPPFQDTTGQRHLTEAACYSLGS